MEGLLKLIVPHHAEKIKNIYAFYISHATIEGIKRHNDTTAGRIVLSKGSEQEDATFYLVG